MYPKYIKYHTTIPAKENKDHTQDPSLTITAVPGQVLMKNINSAIEKSEYCIVVEKNVSSSEIFAWRY